MSDRFAQPERNGGPSHNGHPEPPPPAAAGFDELRDLLVGPEKEALARLEDPERRLEEISAALPEALVRRGANDKLLVAALRPTIENAFIGSIKRQPKFFADLLVPVIAPTIRRAIAAAFENTLEALRRMTEQTFTLQGLKWRLEAMRSGLSVAEVALRHTLRYRVEQVLLIHRETGVLLQFVAVPGAPSADSDMVSGMLSAIEQFVRDSFKVGEGEGLNTVRVGEFIVWVEFGPRAVLAATIRGTPPADLRPILADTLDGIHSLHARDLADFKGDASPFESCRPELEACLRSEASAPAPAKRSRVGLKLAFALLLITLVTWLGWGALTARTERMRRDQFVSLLEAEPGLVTTFLDRESTPIRVRGFRDPIAADPAQFATAAGIPASAISAQWEPYFSLEPSFVLRRVRREIAPPAGVTLRIEGGTLRAQGRAPHAWVELFRRNARGIPGVTRADDSLLADADLVAWRDLAEKAEAILIRFEGDALAEGQRESLARLAVLAREAAELSKGLGRGTQVEVSGELFRASLIVGAIAPIAGVPPVLLRVGPPSSGTQDSVSFRFLLTDSTSKSSTSP